MSKFTINPIKRILLKRIRKRVYAANPVHYKSAMTFITKSPMREWKDRLWVVEHTPIGGSWDLPFDFIQGH